MNEHFERMPSFKIEGRQAMRDLAVRAINALAYADLVEEMEALNARVFGRRAESICESSPLDDGRRHWQFTPFVELLLIEVESVAKQAGLTDARRRERIEWAMQMSGF